MEHRTGWDRHDGASDRWGRADCCGSGLDYRVTPAGLAEILKQALAGALAAQAALDLPPAIDLEPFTPLPEP
jgi:hypothetical protein